MLILFSFEINFYLEQEESGRIGVIMSNYGPYTSARSFTSVNR